LREFCYLGKSFFKKLEKNWALIFDMDGVLVDNNPFHKKAWKVFCQKYGFELSEEQYRNQIYGRTNRNVLESLFPDLLNSFPTTGFVSLLKSSTNVKSNIPIGILPAMVN